MDEDWNGVELMDWNGMEWNGMDRMNGVESSSGMELEWNGMEWNGME